MGNTERNACPLFKECVLLWSIVVIFTSVCKMLSMLTSLNAIRLQESYRVIENEGYVYSETQLCSLTKIVYRYGINYL